MTRSPSSIRPSQPSRREVLQIFAAGASAAVGSITLAPLSGVASAQSDNTLRIAWLTPAQLDPRSVSGMSEIAVLNALYDYLFETDAGSNLVPVLASSWERSEDGARYRLHLVENAAFHDGSLLTARDVVLVDSMAARRPAAPLPISSPTVESVEAVGDHTVVFQLNAPDPDFLYRLTEYKIVMLKAGAENTGRRVQWHGPFHHAGTDPGRPARSCAPTRTIGGARRPSRCWNFSSSMISKRPIAAVQGGTADGILRLDNFSFLNFTGDTRFKHSLDIATNAHQMTRIRADRPPGNDLRVSQSFQIGDRSARRLGTGAAWLRRGGAKIRPSALPSLSISSMILSRQRGTRRPPPLCWPRQAIQMAWI